MGLTASKTVAILATGDELCDGELLNTNGQFAVQQLLAAGVKPGMQLTVRDDEEQIISAIRYLLQHHSALICIGGLGPTSDDRTRFALAKAIGKELKFCDASWQRITDRLEQLNLAIPHSNKQQAYFPESANVLPNKVGTADGCVITLNAQHIFMFPGPPNEFCPLFNDYALPLLTETLMQPNVRASWLLFGVSESNIAQCIDPLMNELDADIGYRVSFPYLEVKLQARSDTQLQNAKQAIWPCIEKKVMSDNRQTYSEQLRDYLANTQQKVALIDHATGSALLSTLLNPNTYPNINQNADLTVTITGLDEYWQNQQTGETTLRIEFSSGKVFEKPIRLRKRRTIRYAVELICGELLRHFSFH